MNQFVRTVAFFTAILWAPHSVLAHDFWLESEVIETENNTTATVTIREGENFKGDSLPYIDFWFSDFSKLDRNGRQSIESNMGDDPAANILLRSGMTLIGYESNRNPVTLKPEKFKAYLEEEGLEYIIDLREELGQSEEAADEFFRRCAKTLISTGQDSENIYTSKLGYILELIPEQNPFALKGEAAQFQLLYLGKPIPGVLVRAVNKSDPETIYAERTNKEGRVSLPLSDSGEWLIKAVHMVQLDEDQPADWESYWASLTFTIE